MGQIEEKMPKKTVRREIIREPGTGRKAVRVFGYVLFGISIFVLFVTFTVGVARNLSVLVLVIPAVMIVFSLLLIRVGRRRKEVMTEEIEEEDNKGEE